jgi:hypothetical protein
MLKNMMRGMGGGCRPDSAPEGPFESYPKAWNLLLLSP